MDDQPATENKITAGRAPETAVPTFREVYGQHLQMVWRVLRSLGVRESDLEDVCQEVFVVVHRKLPEFDGRSAITTWLYGISLRTASAYRRKAYHRREEVVEVLPDEPTPAAQHEVLARQQAMVSLNAILDRLDDDKREVFVLFEIEEQPMSEVAAALGCPLQTAYSRLHAARKLVTAAIEKLHATRSSR